MPKGLNQFIDFNTPGFLAGKQLTTIGVSPLADFESKKEMGTKVETAVTKDETKYTFKQGVTFTNLYEKLTLKVIGKKVDVPIGAIVEPVDPVGTVYGEYRNQLSIKCSDIKIISAPTAPKV